MLYIFYIFAQPNLSNSKMNDMKKTALIVVAALAMLASNVSAQYLPTKGSFGTEVQFNPFDQDGHTFKLDGVKFRYFLSDHDALRLKVGFGLSTDKYKADDSKDDFVKTNTGDFSVGLGYERHFNVAKRLDVYVGGQVGVYKHFASAKMELTDDNIVTYKYEFKNYIPGTGVNEVIDRSYFGVAASIFTGLDFYVYKGLYIGTEFGLYIQSQKTCEGEMKSSDVGTVKLEDSERVSTYKFDIEPTLRLGWTF